MTELNDDGAVIDDAAGENSGAFAREDGEREAAAKAAADAAVDDLAALMDAASPGQAAPAESPRHDAPSQEPLAAREQSAAAEASGSATLEPHFLHPDASSAATSSQRLRLIPPDSKPASWWAKNRRNLALLEYVLTVVFFLLAMYFLYKWIFYSPAVAYAPGEENLFAALLTFSPAKARQAWKVTAGLAGFFFLLTLFFLHRALVVEDETPYAADLEGFRAALAARPPIRSGADWKVAAAPGRWKRIVVHHTAAGTGSVASIDKYHREVNKWPNGLGYHFLIGNGHGMGDGEVRPGRRWLEQLDGAHVKMKGSSQGNATSIGVALVGNFEDAVPSSRQLAALRGLLSFLTAEYGIPSSEIYGHGSVAARHTACPGKLFFLNEVIKVL